MVHSDFLTLQMVLVGVNPSTIW
uniref:Uncharacterized protein n=1 Tax=Arundo donax TaxID=35708 RepID=A0A0A9CWR0_ARUDO